MMDDSKTYQFWLITFNIFLISFYVTGWTGHDGTECGVTCPTTCGADDLNCFGGEDANGCSMPNFCIPMKGG